MHFWEPNPYPFLSVHESRGFLTMRRSRDCILGFRIRFSLEVKISERLTAKTEECVRAVAGIVHLGLSLDPQLPSCMSSISEPHFPNL